MLILTVVVVKKGFLGHRNQSFVFPQQFQLFSCSFFPHKFFVKFNEFKRVLMNFDVFWPNRRCGDFGGIGIVDEDWFELVEFWGKTKD